VTLRTRTAEGDTLELTAFDGKHFALVSSKAYAPGQPITLTVELVPTCLLELKSLGSKRRDDERFDVKARAMTLAKPTRDRIVAALDGG
jgi:hypothetical protein